MLGLICLSVTRGLPDCMMTTNASIDLMYSTRRSEYPEVLFLSSLILLFYRGVRVKRPKANRRKVRKAAGPEANLWNRWLARGGVLLAKFEGFERWTNGASD